MPRSMILIGMDTKENAMNRRNYRRYLMTGIRQRIAREKYGLRLLTLYSFLFDAGELPTC